MSNNIERGGFSPEYQVDLSVVFAPLEEEIERIKNSEAYQEAKLEQYSDKRNQYEELLSLVEQGN